MFHNQLVKSAPWFTERSVTDISVGGLIVLVLVRAVQFNMNNTRVSMDAERTVGCSLYVVNKSLVGFVVFAFHRLLISTSSSIVLSDFRSVFVCFQQLVCRLSPCH